MLEYIYAYLQYYFGIPIAQTLQNFAIECESIIGGGYNEEYVVLAYTSLMGMLTIAFYGLFIYALIYIFSLLWKGVKNII